MQHLTILAIALAIAAGTSWSGPLEDGQDAFDRADYVKALRIWRPLAVAGNSGAQVSLGLMFAKGQGIANDDREAVRWFRMAAVQGSATGQHNLGYMYAEGRGVEHSEQQAALWFRRAAEQDYAASQFNLGLRYDKGVGLPRDAQQAIIWYRKAAEQDEVEAQFNLGVMYEDGEGTPKDESAAAFWYRKAAEQGDANAQYKLGLLFASGRGVNKDEQQAVAWYEKAARQGHVVGQFNLGSMFANGRGTTKDDQQAFIWYRRAAEQGHLHAQGVVGRMYLGGEGVQRDPTKAVDWFLKAANQGDPKAQLLLGLLFESGTDLTRDVAQALRWLIRSANQGNSSAQARLGYIYSKGDLVARDDQMSYYWLLLASAQGDAKAVALRDAIEEDLSPSVRLAAQAAARDWRPVKFPSEDPPPSSATVAPRSDRGDRPNSTGTGILVARDQVATNHHVIEGCARLRVGGNAYGRVLASDKRNDLALVSYQGSTTSSAVVRSGRLKMGESVIVAGYPLTGLLAGLNITTGNVSSLAGPGGDSRLIQMTAPVQPGNSGGPLLDASGNVIGVVVSKLDALKVAELTGDLPQNVNFAINANVLSSFLDASGVAYRSSGISSTIPAPEIAQRARSFTLLIECWK